MPDKLGYLTAHEIGRKLLDSPDLPVYLYEDYRDRAIDIIINDNRIHLANVDECGMPSDPLPDHKYYYLVDKNDSNNIKCDKYGIMVRFGHRQFAEEYLKTQPDYVIKEATNDEYMLEYRLIHERYLQGV
jgi:hypothetical protein